MIRKDPWQEVSEVVEDNTVGRPRVGVFNPLTGLELDAQTSQVARRYIIARTILLL